MDLRRLDAALEALQTGTTRRAGIAAALGALLGGAGVRAVMDTASAGGRDTGARRRRNRPGTAGPCGDGTRKDNICTNDKECCTGICNRKTGKRNRDGKGRCRCLRRGAACTTDKNCCSPMSCVSGVCRASGGGGCTSNSECTGATDICTSGTCTCGSGAACDGATPFCVGGACVACTSDANCSGCTPYCSRQTGVCIGDWSNQTTFGSYGSGSSQFNTPSGVCASVDGLTAVVADATNDRMSVWTRPDAASTTWTNQTTFGVFGVGSGQLSVPHGSVISVDGRTVWVADSLNNRISIWTRPDASSTAWANQTTFGSTGTANDQFGIPRAIFVSLDELTAWVADANNNRISIWTRPDASSTAWANQTIVGDYGSGTDQFDFPTGVYASVDGLTMWVADSGNNRVSVWTRPDASSTAWTNQTTFGSAGAGADQFTWPAGVAVSLDGLKTWVVDSDNNRISIWTRPDASSTAWTNQTTFGSGPGSASDQLTAPFGISIAPDGLTAWVADKTNNRVSVWIAQRACDS